MDGLLAILIIYGICKKLFGSRKNKRKANPLLGGSAQKNVQRVRQIHEEKMKRQQQQEQQEQPIMDCETLQPEEGQALPCFEGSGHTGSLHVESTEGMDLCDPSLEHDRELAEDPQSVYAGEIGREPLLDFSAKGLYQGVVMSEILQRRALRRPRH